MKWTHRFTIKHWGRWFLIDINKPGVVVREGFDDVTYNIGEAFERYKRDRDFEMEELYFTLENE
ncbi:hypothetical protein [Citrobacter phage CVT22]|uniref:Uncharacterized protein n=1 Tax=Citrobacter phage CVT22 TaxID=1622234 RepID=A0A0R6CN34_9CAUD|nr:hypothetical protein APL39_gp49 [Citrobacter phage CVT22]AJT60753.1 hypothetical protein [Citrobacter phage CVT22]